MLPYAEDKDGCIALAPEIEPGYESEQTRKAERRTLVRSCALLGMSLLLTAAVAWGCAERDGFGSNISAHRALYFSLLFAETFCVAFIRRVVSGLSLAGALAMLIAYSALNGISFSVFLLFIPSHALAYAFAVAAFSFLGIAVFGGITGKDLGLLSGTMLMFAIGYVLLGFLRAGMHWNTLYLMAAFMSVTTFGCLWAYHAEHIRDLATEFDDDERGWKSSVLGALVIYLDFLTLYLVIMSMLGRSRSSIEDSEE